MKYKINNKMSSLKNKSIKKSINRENEKINEKKEYSISAEDSEFSLLVEIDNKYINFSVHESNIIFNYIYRNKYDLSKIISQLNLVQSKYTSLSKLLKFIDKAYSKNKISIEQKSENELSLIFEIPVDYEEGKYALILKKKKIEDRELLPILIDQINKLNSNNAIVKNKFNEIERQINSISRKNTINKGSETSDINEEINIIKQQLNDINMKLSGIKTTTDIRTRDYNNDRISPMKSSISKNTENDYNNTYKSLKLKKNELFEEKEDHKFMQNKNKNNNKHLYDNERYNDNNEEEFEKEDKHEIRLKNNNKKILNRKESQEKNRNSNQDEYKDLKKSIKKSQRDSNALKISKKNKKSEDFNEDKKNENDVKPNIQSIKKSKIRNEQLNKKEKYYNNNYNDKEDNYSNNNSTFNKYNNSIFDKKYVNNNESILGNKIKISQNPYKLKQSNFKNSVKDNNLKNGKEEKRNSELMNQINNSDIENGKIISKKITYVEKSEKEIEDYSKKKNYIYNSSPIQFKYKMDICNTNTSCGWNDMFEIFISYQNNREYLVSPDNNNFNINIISLKNKELEISLQGHKNRIRAIRYFINEYINNENENNENNENKAIYEYLISADDDHIVIVWDILNNYEIKQKIDTNYEDDIYSCLIYFNKDDINQKYIITSTYSTSNDIQSSATKIYSLETGEYIFHIKESNFDNIYYLLLWHNKEKNKDYLIQLSYKKIMINELEPKNNEPYAKLVKEPENEHYSGFIYSKNDSYLLCTSCYNGYINVWNLNTKKCINTIDTNCILCHIIQWSEKYIIAADFENKSFIIVDIDKKKIYNDINAEHSMEVKCIKKFLHPKFGECLLTAGRDNSIKLWKL